MEKDIKSSNSTKYWARESITEIHDCQILFNIDEINKENKRQEELKKYLSKRADYIPKKIFDLPTEDGSFKNNIKRKKRYYSYIPSRLLGKSTYWF